MIISREPYESIVYRPTKVECDRCHKIYEDEMELQEFHHIYFEGGYGSVFGDTNRVECDLCQRCLLQLVGNYCRINHEE